MIELTDTQVIEGLQALVDEKGEGFVYEQKPEYEGSSSTQCVYVYQGKADCMVGQFLVKAGVPLERLAEADNSHYGQGVPALELVSQLQDEGVLSMSETAQEALGYAQGHQDIGETWGYALRGAKERFDI